MQIKKWVFAIVATAGLITTPAGAQDVSMGKEIFHGRCAVCDGVEGKGDGLVGELFRQRPKNLALLTKENGGVFPLEKVYQSIDRRSKIAGHGDSNMPVWGEYFMVDTLSDQRIDPKAARDIVAGRIYAVVYYLESIQSK
jgi:mono/diheme cytochrome c family protein